MELCGAFALAKKWLSVDLDPSLHSRSMAYLILMSLSLTTYKTGIVIMSASKCYDDEMIK